jgi:PleD family two-component response regulator
VDMAVPISIKKGLISALVIDDNAFDRRRLLRIADETNLDFYLKEVSNVEEFGHILDQEKFDVIFVDLNLAGASGLNLLPGVRSHHVNKDAAMIMVAGNSQAELALEALRAGFSDYIEKEALSKSSLERATVNALQKMRLSNAAFTAEAETKSVEAVLKTFAEACSEEMRPMMSRMLRQIRQMKSETEHSGASNSITQIETTCTRMEEFFRDLASLADEGRLSSVVGPGVAEIEASRVATHDAATPGVVADQIKQPRVRTMRPSRPSLFSRKSLNPT